MPFLDTFLRSSFRRKPLYDAHSVKVLTVSLNGQKLRDGKGSFFFLWSNFFTAGPLLEFSAFLKILRMYYKCFRSFHTVTRD